MTCTARSGNSSYPLPIEPKPTSIIINQINSETNTRNRPTVIKLFSKVITYMVRFRRTIQKRSSQAWGRERRTFKSIQTTNIACSVCSGPARMGIVIIRIFPSRTKVYILIIKIPCIRVLYVWNSNTQIHFRIRIWFFCCCWFI